MDTRKYITLSCPNLEYLSINTRATDLVAGLVEDLKQNLLPNLRETKWKKKARAWIAWIESELVFWTLIVGGRFTLGGEPKKKSIVFTKRRD
ncbi:hypothetical protein YC2023_115333 [Brassica napus]